MKRTACTCKRVDCKVELLFDAAGSAILMRLDETTDQIMYVDPNTVVSLIANLSEMLLAMEKR